MADRRRCLDVWAYQGVFGDGRFNGIMQNVVGLTLVATATKFGPGAEIRSPTGLFGFVFLFLCEFQLRSIHISRLQTGGRWAGHGTHKTRSRAGWSCCHDSRDVARRGDISYSGRRQRRNKISEAMLATYVVGDQSEDAEPSDGPTPASDKRWLLASGIE